VKEKVYKDRRRINMEESESTEAENAGNDEECGEK